MRSLFSAGGGIKDELVSDLMRENAHCSLPGCPELHWLLAGPLRRETAGGT